MNQYVVQNIHGEFSNGKGFNTSWAGIAFARVFPTRQAALNSDAYRGKHRGKIIPLLDAIPDGTLLKELIKRNGTADGPRKTVYGAGNLETIVGIGNDHIATISYHKEDLEALDADRTT